MLTRLKLEQRQAAHVKVVADFTNNEATSFLKYKDSSSKLQNILNTSTTLTDAMRTIYEQQIVDNNIKTNEIYNKIESYPAAVEAAALQKAEIAKKKKELDGKKKALERSS